MKIIKYILWLFLIRSKLKKSIKSVTGEREYYKNVLTWDNITKEDEEYIERMINVQNIILSALRNLL